jgi:hypothetical protein
MSCKARIYGNLIDATKKDFNHQGIKGYLVNDMSIRIRSTTTSAENDQDIKVSF